MQLKDDAEKIKIPKNKANRFILERSSVMASGGKVFKLKSLIIHNLYEAETFKHREDGKHCGSAWSAKAKSHDRRVGG